MTPNELLCGLKALDERLEKEKRDAVERHRKNRQALLVDFACRHARFHAGDVIASPDGGSQYNLNETTIRVERIEVSLDKEPAIRYVGTLLNPDLTENGTSCKYTITARKGVHIEKLERPKYTTYTASDGKDEWLYSTFGGALSRCRAICSRGRDATVYGYNRDGTGTKLLFVPSIHKNNAEL